MAEIKEFVINDRRKFTAEGEARPDAPPSVPKPPRPEPVESSARMVETPPAPGPVEVAPAHAGDAEMPPAPTAEENAQASQAYAATVDRLDTAIRATNPGMEPMPEMSFERVVQSVYMQALLQMGGATEPGQEPRVDLLGARQTIDMLGVIAAKTAGNLSENEQKLMDSALFELRMGFLEITQALARQAQARQPGGPQGPGPAAPAGPKIVA